MMIGPQRLPSSLGQIQAQQRFVEKRLKEIDNGENMSLDFMNGNKSIQKAVEETIKKYVKIVVKYDEQGKQILPATTERIETGPLQFGDDWPGVFIRGDSSGYYAMTLKLLIDNLENKRYEDIDWLTINNLKNLKGELTGCIVGPAKGIVDG